MKQAKKRISFLIITIILTLCACGSSADTSMKDLVPPTSQESVPSDPIGEEPPEETDLPEDPPVIPDLSEVSFSPSEAAPYDSEAYTVINNNLPFFSEEDLSEQSYEVYSELDDLGRCGVAYANIGPDLMPTEERESIGNVKPTGWHTVKYDSIDGNYLYNRCHLIGYQLSGENANKKNLITGTRYLNVEGMLPFENMVADYVKETGNHVLYRVTPVYEGDNLLVSGVLMEAESVEDKGADILFCVYVYNVQPGIAIDYATGESALADVTDSQVSAQIQAPELETQAPMSEPEAQAQAPEPETQTPESEAQIPEQEPEVQEPVSQDTTYILNTNTKKFHIPTCYSIKQMKDSTKEEYTGSRDEVISRGYDPCKKCHP